MSTRRSVAAYRERLAREHEAHLRQTYGMLPVKTRHPRSKCGCGKHDLGVGETMVHFREGWWATDCVDEVRRQEFKATARWQEQVLVRLRTGDEWHALNWTNSAREAAVWASCATIDDTSSLRVFDTKLKRVVADGEIEETNA